MRLAAMVHRFIMAANADATVSEGWHILICCMSAAINMCGMPAVPDLAMFFKSIAILSHCCSSWAWILLLLARSFCSVFCLHHSKGIISVLDLLVILYVEARPAKVPKG